MKQTILYILMILFLLLCCLFHAIHVLIFHQSGFTVIYNVYMLLENSEVKACLLDVYIFLVINIMIYDHDNI